MFACAAALPCAVAAQQSGDTPSLRLGLTTSVVAHDNRGLDDPSAGSTFEYTTRLDFGVTFATPIQQLAVSGDIGLRHVNGAESDSLDSGLVEPSLNIGYARQSRDAELTVDLRYSEVDISSSSLENVIGVPDPTLVTAEGTRRNLVFDTSLELRRRAPFGVTFFAGYTSLRNSDAAASTLADQDRFRVGADLRFDLTPTSQLNVNLSYRTFEEFNPPAELRETFRLDAGLRQELRNGDASFNFGITSTEDGERFTLSAGRTLITPVWEFGASLGFTREVDGDIAPIGTLNLTRDLPDGSLGASFSRRVTAGSDDEEDEITAFDLTYDKQLNALTNFSANLSFRETDPTAAGSNATSLGTIGVSLSRSLTPTWQMDFGLQHRISKNSVGTRARDNRLSISLRRDLTARR